MEDSIPVRLISTFGELVDCEVNDILEDVLSREAAEPFDHLPVRLGRQYVGILSLYKARRDDGGSMSVGRAVENVMQPLNEDCLISAETGLLSFVVDADRAPCRLVVRGTRVDGIVTLSDLQKLPVRSALITLVTHLELLMTAVIKNAFPNDETFFDYITSEQRRDKAKATWARQNLEGLDLDVSQALDFCDKRDLLTKIEALPWSNRKISSELKKIEDLRNSLAHVSNYAGTRKRAYATIEAVRKMQDWIPMLRDFQQQFELPTKSEVEGAFKAASSF